MTRKNEKLLGVLVLSAGLAVSGFCALVLSDIRIENVNNAVLDESFVKAYTSLRAVVDRWLLFLPLAILPLWQLEQPVLTLTLAWNFAGVQLL